MNKQKTGLYEKLARLQWLFHRRQLQEHLEYGPIGNPTRGQGRVLAILKMQQEISTKDLAYLLGIRQSSLNELLGKLEKNEYITRSQSNDDRRVIMVRLTEKGKNEQQRDYCSGNIFDCLNEEEQQTFEIYLDRVITELEAQVGEDPEVFDWMTMARERFGDNFDRMASMRCGMNNLRGFRHGGRDPGYRR